MEDFFGNPVDERGRRPAEPVACPLCGEGFTAADALAAHVRFLHGLDERTLHGRPASDRPARLRRWWASLGFLPLWFVLPLNVALVVLVWKREAIASNAVGYGLLGFLAAFCCSARSIRTSG